MKPILRKILMFSGLALFLTSCATTSLVDTWRNPVVPGFRLHKIMVVNITRIGEMRRLYEDVLASAFRAHGVEAVPSYTLIPADGQADLETLEKAVQKSGVEAVLTLQTVRIEGHIAIQPDIVYPDYWYPWATAPYPPCSPYGFYDAMAFCDPSDISTGIVVSIQVNLLSAQTDKLVWAANFRTSEPGKVVTISKDLARLIIQSLVKVGLI